MTARLRGILAHDRQILRPTKRGALFFLFFAAAFLLFAHPALAVPTANEIGESVGLLFGNICLGLTKFLGSLLLLITDSFLIPISSYNGFVSSAAVSKGWVIVRDLTNMFFVLMMLIIAVGTILGVEEFSYRRLLPRLLIMAILINFSKVIVGIFVDLAQVVMLTFVNGYSAAAGGNILQLYHLKELVNPSDKISEATALNIWDYVGAQLLGLLMMAIGLFVTAVMCMMLVFRIVMIWVLTILSPLAFFLSTFPKGKAQAAYSRWWELFGNYVVSGPLLAFFLWLAFSLTASGGIGNEVSTGEHVREAPNQYFFTEAGSSYIFADWIVGIALLLAGMYVTADLGVAAGGMLRSGADWIKGSAQRLAKGALLLPLRAGIGGVKMAGRGAAGVAKVGARWGESQFYGRTGLMIPFSERAKKRREALREARYGARETAGNVIRAKGFRGGGAPWHGFGGKERVDKRVQEAAEARGKLSGLEGKKEELLRPAAEQRDRANNLRNLTGGESLQMGSEMRALFTKQKEEFVKMMNDALRDAATTPSPAVKQGHEARAEKYMQQAADIERAMNVEDGESLRWDSNKGLEATKIALRADADKLEKQAVGLEAAPEIRAVDAEIEMARPKVEKVERKAMKAKQRHWRDPEARMLMYSVSKAEHEAEEKLPPSMTFQDRQDQLASAFQRKDKFAAKVMLQKIAKENELVDAMTSGAMGEKFDNDAAGVEKLAQLMQKRFGMTEQESLRTLNDAFQSAAGKGDTIFHGKFAQDARSGAMRVASDPDNSVVQSKKLDRMSIPELVRKDNVNAIFNIKIDSQGNAQRELSDAGLYKLAASQEKIMDELKDGRVHPKILGALKDNEDKMREAVRKGLLSIEFVEKIASAVAKKSLTATELAKKYKRRV